MIFINLYNIIYMNNNRINVIFYSRKCQSCMDLLKLLENENLLGSFVLFCVDGRLSEVPSHISSVPTMVVSNVNKPLIGNETFEWINKVKFLRQQNLMQINKKIITQQNVINMMNKKEIVGYDSEILGKISDPFAIADEASNKSLPQSYYNINDNKDAIFTAPEQGKITKQEQKKRIENIEQLRSTQDSQYGELMKKQQIDAVLRSEQELFHP